MTLAIGTDFLLPDDTVTSTLVVYGAKGMGKTNLGAVLVEELKKAELRFAVIDPVGVWYGLQHSADGKLPGIEVLILGGMHGDIPIEPTAGAVVADLVADEEADVVIDVSRRANGTMWSQGEKIRFIADYCSRLYERQGERRRPLMQVIDEAGRFVPQQIPSGAVDIARCVGAIEQLVELGRNVGVGVTLITQRSARMNKSVSELADCMIAFRTVGPRSIDAILDWFGEHVPRERWKTLIEELRTLPVGTALVVSPGWLNYEGIARVRARETFDSSATPKAGATVGVTGRAAKPDLGLYQQRMVETVERAKADDPRELRRQLAEAQKQARVETRVEKVVERVEVSVLTYDDREVLRAFGEWAESLGEWVNTVQPILEKALSQVTENVRVALPPPHLEPHPTSPRESRLVPERESRPQGENGSLPRAQRRILTVLAQHGASTRSQVAILSGYSGQSSGFANALSSLRTNGYIERGDPIKATTEGLAALGTWEPLPQGEELQQWWYGQLGRAEKTILQVLVANYPQTLSRTEIADRSGYSPTSSGYSNALSRLRTLDLISGYGNMLASSSLFLGGLIHS